MDGYENDFKHLFTTVFADTIQDEYNWSGRLDKKAMTNLRIVWSIMFRKKL
jgi:Domain of unknown function (DUF4806)